MAGTKIPFTLPASHGGATHETWCITFGDLHASNKTPLILLHGGPSACHEYMLPLKDLADQHGIPLVFYDQMGNGQSTHIKEKTGDESFWTVSLFLAELDNLVDKLGLKERGFDLYGHSWGAMFGSEYATLRPKGLRRLILADGPASIEKWLEGIHQLRLQLPQNIEDVLFQAEKEGRFDGPEYEKAVEFFYKRHLCRAEPWPAPEVEIAVQRMMSDTLIYPTMYGPAEMVATGNLKDWSVIDKLHNIDVPTLLINGRYDEAQDVCMQPFFDIIKQVKWVTLERSSHFGFVEERERYVGVIAQFLLK